MVKIALKITYDGARFCGWQKQPDKRTVQEEIEFAIFSVTSKKVTLYASGRTDAGVHALGQIGHFELDDESAQKIKIHSLAASINAFLDSDVRVLSAWIADPDFDSRFTAKKKTYIYKFYVSRFEHPLKIGRELRVNDKIDVGAMARAVSAVEGTRDFTSFVARKSGKIDFVRTILSAKINQKSDFEYEFEITGTGFLYNMVRIIMGTLIEVGMHRIKEADVAKIIEAKNRALSGKTMPPYALYLKEVTY